MHITQTGGTPFEDGEDGGRIIVSGRDTAGRYSLMEYVVAARAADLPGAEPCYGMHRHRDIEETFFVRSGSLRFVLGEDVISLGPGDFVRVPAGVRHGFANVSGERVDLLVGFVPGGFEELFVRHRTDQSPQPRAEGFIEDAMREFSSEFEA